MNNAKRTINSEQLTINNGKKAGSNLLYTLMPLEEFKEIQGIDDRDDKLASFCLITSTLTIEQYCKRWLLSRKKYQVIEFVNDDRLILNEYPVEKISAVFANFRYEYPEIVEPEFYKAIPEEKSGENIPYMIIISPAIMRLKNLTAFRVMYRAGYAVGDVPADLSAACMELAAWNFNRYRGRRVGMTGNIKGAGKEGEHFEMALPENVKGLLEPYKRKTI